MNMWLLVVAGWLVDFGWVATVLLAAAAAIRLVMRDPGSRVMLAWGTWLSLVGGGVLVALPMWPRWEISQFIERREPPAAVVVAIDQPALAEPVVVVESLSDAVLYQPVDPQAVPPSVLFAWPQLLTVAWLTAALVAGGWMAVGFLQARRLVRTSKGAPTWIVREFRQIAECERPRAEVRTSDWLSSAVALGAVRPRIVLPEASAEPANVKAVRAALAHEWAHIRHGDLWLLALERLLVPLLAPHPLYWWLRRSTRLDQELLADAAAAGDKPVEYAEALVAWAKEPARGTVGLAALAMWERPSNLSRRVHMILNRNRSLTTRLGRLFGLTAACLVLSLAAGLSTLTMRELAADDEPAAKPAESQQATVPAPLPEAETASATTTFTDKAAQPNAEAPQTDRTGDYNIALELAFFSLDSEDSAETKKEVLELVEQTAGKKLVRIGGPEPLSVEPDQSADAYIIEIDRGLKARLTREMRSIHGVRLTTSPTLITVPSREAHFETAQLGPISRLSVKGRLLAEDARRLAVTIEAGEMQGSAAQPRTVVKSTAGIGNTLVFVSSEPYAILVSPTTMPRARSVPETTISPQTLTTGGAQPGYATPQYVPPPAVQAVPPIPPPPVGAAVPGHRTIITPAPLPALRPDPRPSLSPQVVFPSSQMQRKLLELDLADARLGIEAAEAELAQVNEIRNKNPSAVSEQELRKKKLEVERAKIKVKRIELLIEEAGKAAESPSALPASTPKPSSR